MSTLPGRVLAIDYGRRRIGVALSDPTRTIASPHNVVTNRGEPRQPPQRLLDLVAETSPAVIVVGIPISLDGGEGEMAVEAREFGRRLGEATGIPIVEWDERLTSALARRTLAETSRRGGEAVGRRREAVGRRREAAGRRRERGGRARRASKGEEDMVAAAHLLRSYLDATGTSAGGKTEDE